MLAEIVSSIHVHPQYTVNMHQNLTTFHDILGGCERLLRSPIPLSYTRYTSRLLIIWLAMLPMALWSSLGWAAVGVSAIMGVLLLGIEEVGL